MVSFAVHHESMEEGKGVWVLAVDGGRLLVANQDNGKLEWLEATECSLFACHTPEQPLFVQMAQVPQIVVPSGMQRPNGF